MANITTTSLANSIPALVSKAIARTYDPPKLIGTCNIRRLGQGEGKAFKFNALPYSDASTVASESSAFAATAWALGATGTATVTENGYAIEASDFLLHSSVVTLEDMIAEIMQATKESQDRRVAALWGTASTLPPVETSPLTVAALMAAQARLASKVGSSVWDAGAGGFGGLVAGLSNAQYSSLMTDVAVNKGANFVNTNANRSTIDEGRLTDILGIRILPSRQVSLSAATTAQASGMLYVSGMTFGAAIQADPYVTTQRFAVGPTGSGPTWVVSVTTRLATCTIRTDHCVPLQSDS